MSDQLRELQRQRALVAEHLAWLDRRIAAETARSPHPQRPESTTPTATMPAPSASAPASPPTPSVITAIVATEDGAGAADSEALFARFAAEEQPALRPPSKFGCWLTFSLILLGVLGAVTALIYRAYG